MRLRKKWEVQALVEESDRYEVEVANEQDCLAVEDAWVADVVRKVLEEEGVLAAQVSVALVEHSRSHELNRRFLQHDEPTDVLSFLLECEPEERANEPGGADKRLEGEVVVNAQMALDRAEEFGWSPKDELVLYLVHGVLHLCGYDDQTEEARQQMRAKEREMLRLWNLSPRYNDGGATSRRGED